MNNPGGPNPRNWDPSRYDQEVHDHMRRAHDRLDREINLRYGDFSFWYQPDIRSYNQVRFNVPGDPGDRVIPGQRDSVLAFDYMEGHMERNEATFQLNFVTNEGHNVARLQYWDIEPPIEEVLGNASCIGLFRVLYFWRGTQPINSLSFAMLRE